MYLFNDIRFQVLRHLRTLFRIRVWIFISLVQPIIWLVLFTQVFDSLGQSFAGLPGLENVSYLQFFTPGVVVMCSAQATVSAARSAGLCIRSRSCSLRCCSLL